VSSLHFQLNCNERISPLPSLPFSMPPHPLSCAADVCAINLSPQPAAQCRLRKNPLLPWIGVILLGYVCGPMYGTAMQPGRRKQLLVTIGLGALALLLFLRGFNIYGENAPWVVHETGIQTVMSFLNFTSIRPRWTSS
jgi:uncharacterized membrane protein